MTGDLALAAQAIEPACPLLKNAWVPIKVVVDHMAAFKMEVDPLRHDGTRYEHLGKERGIEGEHQPASRVLSDLAVRKAHIRKRDLTPGTPLTRIE